MLIWRCRDWLRTKICAGAIDPIQTCKHGSCLTKPCAYRRGLRASQALLTYRTSPCCVGDRPTDPESTSPTATRRHTILSILSIVINCYIGSDRYWRKWLSVAQILDDMPGVPSGRGCDGCRKQKKKVCQSAMVWYVVAEAATV